MGPLLRDVCPVSCRMVTDVSNHGPLYPGSSLQFWELETVLDTVRYVILSSGGKSHPSLRTPYPDQGFLFYLFYCMPLNLMKNLSTSRTSYILTLLLSYCVILLALSLLFPFYKLDVSSKTLHWSSELLFASFST